MSEATGPVDQVNDQIKRHPIVIGFFTITWVGMVLVVVFGFRYMEEARHDSCVQGRSDTRTAIVRTVDHVVKAQTDAPSPETVALVGSIDSMLAIELDTDRC